MDYSRVVTRSRPVDDPGPLGAREGSVVVPWSGAAAQRSAITGTIDRLWLEPRRMC